MKRCRPPNWFPSFPWLAVATVMLSVEIQPARGDERALVVFKQLATQFDTGVLPLVRQYCLECHSTEANQGELDLQRFGSFEDVRRDPPRWQKVAELLDQGEMPPKDSPQLTVDQYQQLRDWVHGYLDAEALAHAGDPGPVVLRRLSNAEYTYTVRDLTGVDLEPAREFPVDGAAGEGFTNTGGALVMSPALITKYLDAAKGIAAHAVLLPDGIRFSPGTTRRDWTNEILGEIRELYVRHTGRAGDVNSLNRWNVSNPLQLTDQDGRIDLVRYLSALIRHRERLLADLKQVKSIAQEEQLNPVYLRHLASMLSTDAPPSPLMDGLRARLHAAKLDDASAIAADIREWQEQLWKFNSVGHFGSIRPWQQPVTPLESAREFRVKIEPTNDADEVTLRMVASTAGDGGQNDLVQWQRPRIERPGRPPVLLRDVRAAVWVLQAMREQTLAATSKYLAAAREASGGNDVAAVASARDVDPSMLAAWMSYLGLGPTDELKIDQYLQQPLKSVGGHDFVNGWGVAGLDALSLVGNASDTKVNIPGDMNPHQIAVHPRPERWIAAGWKSPLTGHVRLTPRVHHAHPACGNGVSWALELRHGTQRRVLAAGDLDVGKATAVEPLEAIAVRKGDLVSLVIGPRDRNYVCDLTEVDLSIMEEQDEQRQWSLAGDCADNIDVGNPHPDRLGNEDVWHFYTGKIGDDGPVYAVTPGSLLAQWLDTNDSDGAGLLAERIEALLRQPTAAEMPAADAEVYRQLHDLDGPLFTQIDFAALAREADPTDWQSSPYGLDPQGFGRLPDGSVVASEDVAVQAPSMLEFRLPAGWFADGEFVVSGALHSRSEQGSVQLQVTSEGASASDELQPGIPVIVHSGSAAATRFEQAFDDFRQLFPTALCYPQIVPVDEVVTLVLYHREDQHLARLMLDDVQAARLDRLWDELRYVSQDALTMVAGFEQLMEFATQDSDPSLFEPLREPINERAAAFRQQLLDTESMHVQAVLNLAAQAYRRPLSQRETNELRQLHERLRKESLTHDEAVRLMLARVLTAPAFLYRLEQPVAGPEPGPVSGWEMASRLSYFLWSSLPDEELRALAASKRMADAGVLQDQTRRMIRDERTRRLAVEFACQWLHIRDFDQLDEKSERHFPSFVGLRDAMYEESIQFFTDLFQNGGSVLDILDADHTFLNAALAAHYGIPGIEGNHWRRVDDVRRFSRGGILTQATTLAKQSGASRTSPILRGNWVSETLLGERLPRPPKDVPPLPEGVPDGLTERQLIEQHTSNASCAKCHARIDPYGFALEGFDAIGRFRQQDAGGLPIDARTTLADGSNVEGVDGLRDYLLGPRRDTFVRHFCRKLLGYALGRAVQLSDQPLLDKMMAQLTENDHRVSVAVETIVLSPQFRNRRGEDLQRRGDE